MIKQLQSFGNKNKAFEYLLVKAGENLSIFSILFFSISTNVFVYLITTKFSILITSLLLLEVILFTIAGFYYQKLFRKYELARNYVYANSITPDTDDATLTIDEKAIFTRIKKDIDGSPIVKARYLYFLPYLGYLIGIYLLVNNLIPEKSSSISTEISTQQTPHTKKILETYDQFANSHKIYDFQNLQG